MLVEITGLVTFVRVMRTGLLDRASWRRALVAVPLRIQVSWNMPLVGMMRTRLFGGLISHCVLLCDILNLALDGPSRCRTEATNQAFVMPMVRFDSS